MSFSLMRANLIDMLGDVAIKTKHLESRRKVIVDQPNIDTCLDFLAVRRSVFGNMIDGKKFKVGVSTAHAERCSATIVTQNKQTLFFAICCCFCSHSFSIGTVKSAPCFLRFFPVSGVLLLSSLGHFLDVGFPVEGYSRHLLLCIAMVPFFPIAGVTFKKSACAFVLAILAFSVKLILFLVPIVKVIGRRRQYFLAGCATPVSIRGNISGLLKQAALLPFGRLATFAQGRPAIFFASIAKEKLFGCILELGASIAELLFAGLRFWGVLGYSVHTVEPPIQSSRPGSVDALAGANIITSTSYHIPAFKTTQGGFCVC